MNRDRHLHGLSDWGKTEFHTDGHRTLDPMDMIIVRVICTSSLKWLKWESSMVWWTDRTSWGQWYTEFSGVGWTIWSSLWRMETSYHQMVKMNENYQRSKIQVGHFKNSTNTISPTDATQDNEMENIAQLSPGGLVRVQFHFVFDDYSD